MSVAIFRNESELKKAGLQLDPVTGEVSTIPQGVVWEMTDEEFAAHAAKYSAGELASMIQDARKQVVRCLKRGAEWYYTAGRWLLWARKKQVYGAAGWEAFCEDECAISPSQAWKYMQFAERYSPREIASFGDERFSLEKALGYETEAGDDDDPPQKDDNTGSRVEAEASSQDEQGEQEENPTPPVVGQQDKSKEKAARNSKKRGQTATPTTPIRKQWKITAKTKPEVSVIYPGKFRFRFDDAASHEFHLDRDQAEQLLAQLAAAMEKDDELGKECGNRPLPERSAELQCPRLAEGTAQPVH